MIESLEEKQDKEKEYQFYRPVENVGDEPEVFALKESQLAKPHLDLLYNQFLENWRYLPSAVRMRFVDQNIMPAIKEKENE